jgi:hypothetical protein
VYGGTEERDGDWSLLIRDGASFALDFAASMPLGTWCAALPAGLGRRWTAGLAWAGLLGGPAGASRPAAGARPGS